MIWFKPLQHFFLVITLASVNLLWAASEELTFDNEELRERYAELTFQLRCPKCDNQNVADSNAPISQDIRQKTYEMLHQDYSDQEIIDFMISRYTEFVTYKPQLSLVTIWLWIIPLLVLLIGFTFLVKLTKRKGAAATIELTEAEQQRLDALLKDEK